MSRIHEALRLARQHQFGSSKDLPDVEEIISMGMEDDGETPQDGAGAAIPPPSGDGPLEVIPQVAPATADPILAACSVHSWPHRGKGLVFLSGEANIIAQEQFRTLRSRLYQMRSQRTLKVIVISSAIPEEGKSFVAANLAHAFASQNGRRALVIDADLRRDGGVSSMLEAPSTPGLADYLLGEKHVGDLIQTGSIDRLYFIPSGRRVAQPGDLIGDPKLGELILKLRPAFDWIIIDTPPVLPIADARAIADLSDGVLMVVNSIATLSRLAKRAVHEFRRESLLGVILNRTTDPSATRYGAYGYDYSAPPKKRLESCK